MAGITVCHSGMDVETCGGSIFPKRLYFEALNKYLTATGPAWLFMENILFTSVMNR